LNSEARDLLSQCLSFDPFARPSLDQILSNPWFAKTNPNWAHLIAKCTFVDNENEVEEGKGRTEINGKQRQESGLASECCSGSHCEGGDGNSQATIGCKRKL
jgi:serine/threonine protein kinase